MADEGVPSALTLILEQLRDITGEVKPIPQLQSKIGALDDKIGALDEAMREMASDLRTRDYSQQQAIDALHLQQSETMAAIAGISSSLNDLKFSQSEQCQRLGVLEGQVKASFDAQLQQGWRLREMEERVDTVDKKVETIVDPAAVQKVIDEVEEKRPWLSGIIWFLKIIFYMAATAAAGAVLYLVAEAIIKSL